MRSGLRRVQRPVNRPKEFPEKERTPVLRCGLAPEKSSDAGPSFLYFGNLPQEDGSDNVSGTFAARRVL
jgi:hypothetical protein